MHLSSEGRQFQRGDAVQAHSLQVTLRESSRMQMLEDVHVGLLVFVRQLDVPKLNVPK